jgi:hypothetical protein
MTLPISVLENHLASIRRNSINTEQRQKVINTLNIARNNRLTASIKTMIETEANAARKIELAVYLTHVRLESAHLQLALLFAIQVTLTNKNYLTAKLMIPRFLDLSPPAKYAEFTQRKLAQIRANTTNALPLAKMIESLSTSAACQ